MTWTYLEPCTSSQEPVEVSSQTYCWDTDPCALLKSNPIADKYCSNDNETTSFPDSPSGTTSEHLTEPSGEGESMSFAEDSLVQTCPVRGRVQESLENKAVFGQNLPESLARYDPATHSLRTAQCLLFEDSTESCATLPKWGIMQDGACWGLTHLGFLIEGEEFGLWPTPSGTSNHGKNHVIGRLDEWGGSSNPFRGSRNAALRLPGFEEWMMGWPVAWTELMPYEMDRFQQWLRLHGKS